MPAPRLKLQRPRHEIRSRRQVDDSARRLAFVDRTLDRVGVVMLPVTARRIRSLTHIEPAAIIGITSERRSFSRRDGRHGLAGDEPHLAQPRDIRLTARAMRAIAEETNVPRRDWRLESLQLTGVVIGFRSLRELESLTHRPPAFRVWLGIVLIAGRILDRHVCKPAMRRAIVIPHAKCTDGLRLAKIELHQRMLVRPNRQVCPIPHRAAVGIPVRRQQKHAAPRRGLLEPVVVDQVHRAHQPLDLLARRPRRHALNEPFGGRRRIAETAPYCHHENAASHIDHTALVRGDLCEWRVSRWQHISATPY